MVNTLRILALLAIILFWTSVEEPLVTNHSTSTWEKQDAQ